MEKNNTHKIRTQLLLLYSFNCLIFYSSKVKDVNKERLCVLFYALNYGFTNKSGLLLVTGTAELTEDVILQTRWYSFVNSIL